MTTEVINKYKFEEVNLNTAAFDSDGECDDGDYRDDSRDDDDHRRIRRRSHNTNASNGVGVPW